MKKIVVIGKNPEGDQAYLAAIDFLDAYGADEWSSRIRYGSKDVEFFDMTSNPWKGDAIDHIDESVELVVALHLHGMRPGMPDVPGNAIYYSGRNHEILPICRKLGVPLLVVGEQPSDNASLVVMYLEDDMEEPPKEQ